jgi:hypothetical protein
MRRGKEEGRSGRKRIAFCRESVDDEKWHFGEFSDDDECLPSRESRSLPLLVSRILSWLRRFALERGRGKKLRTTSRSMSTTARIGSTKRRTGCFALRRHWLQPV